MILLAMRRKPSRLTTLSQLSRRSSPVPASGVSLCTTIIHTTEDPAMKDNIHPKYVDTIITCTCGAVYNTRSTVKEISVGICASCHPFFTGEQKFVDTAGRVEKFNQRFKSTSAVRRTKPKLAAAGT